MSKRVFAAVLAAALMAAPLPALVYQAQAQTQPASKPTKKAKTKRPLTPGQIAMREREKKCGAEWRAAKKAGKIQKGTTWPKYWSACNKRLKAGGK